MGYTVHVLTFDYWSPVVCSMCAMFWCIMVTSCISYTGFWSYNCKCTLTATPLCHPVIWSMQSRYTSSQQFKMKGDSIFSNISIQFCVIATFIIIYFCFEINISVVIRISNVIYQPLQYKHEVNMWYLPFNKNRSLICEPLQYKHNKPCDFPFTIIKSLLHYQLKQQFMSRTMQ